MELPKDKYSTPPKDIVKYVERAVAELGVDPSLVNDVDSVMYAWRLNYNEKNIVVAKEILNMPSGSLSEMARAMADTDKGVRQSIEHDVRYSLPPAKSH